jgi:psiF repeat
MARISHHVWAAMMSLLLATSLASLIAAKTPLNNQPQSSTASAQDKAKACNDLADKKGLKGQDRATFMQSCLNKAANSASGGNVSQQDKATACKNLADKKSLTGADRRSFVKDCMKKANPQ